jgi:hypothetical protein
LRYKRPVQPGLGNESRPDGKQAIVLEAAIIEPDIRHAAAGRGFGEPAGWLGSV